MYAKVAVSTCFSEEDFYKNYFVTEYKKKCNETHTLYKCVTSKKNLINVKAY